MKHLKVLLTMAIAVFSFTALNAQTTKPIMKNSNTVADSVYECPMKCEGEKTYNKAGKCPVCNMKLKPIPQPAAISYQCPMKCEGDKTYSKEGKCPVCNMALKKVKTKKVNENQDGHNHN